MVSFEFDNEQHKLVFKRISLHWNSSSHNFVLQITDKDGTHVRDSYYGHLDNLTGWKPNSDNTKGFKEWERKNTCTEHDKRCFLWTVLVGT